MLQALLAPTEIHMWDQPAATRGPRLTNDEINEKYLSRDWRIVTEFNREQLPNFVEALGRSGWMDVRPFYQRRARWTTEQQSLLIESFIMNIPVPPLFVYESELARYEVMDGQQRITAISAFYKNQFELSGLEYWPELNGRRYLDLPSEIRKGIDRRSISYTVLLTESAGTTEEQTLLRQLVFERLNTGGVDLSKQEVRNCLYQSAFNGLLFELAKHPVFRDAWDLPRYGPDEDKAPSPDLAKKSFYAKMTDVETVLRFFALRHSNHYQRGMAGFLDLYMVRARQFQDDDLELLRNLFYDTIDLAGAVYGDVLFRPWIKDRKIWSDRAQVAYYDAVMVGVSRHLSEGRLLLEKRERVLEATQELFESHDDGTFTGRGNTKGDVVERIDLFSKMLTEVIGG